MNISLSAFALENLVSRDGFGSPVPRQPAHFHTQAEYGAYLRDSSRVPRWRPFFYFKPPYAIGLVQSLSGHAIAYRWRSLLRVRWHRVSKPQGSSERVLAALAGHHGPAINIRLSFPRTHYWHEVGMMKVPANYTRIIGRNCYFYVLEVHRDFLQCYVFSTCCISQYVTLFVTARGLRYRIFRSSLVVNT